MGLVSPNPGTIFWLLLIFGIVVYILRRFAWTPILNALKDRENSIAEALNAADDARKQIDELKADQEAIRTNALREKENILKEAREIREQMIAEAREKAGQESARALTQLREQMEYEKAAAINEMKRQIAEFSVRIAETIIREELTPTPKQEKLIQAQLEEFKLN